MDSTRVSVFPPGGIPVLPKRANGDTVPSRRPVTMFAPELETKKDDMIDKKDVGAYKI